MAREDLRCNVVGSSHRRIGHKSAGTPPVVNLGSVADSQVNLVNSDGISIVPRPIRSSKEELLVVVVVMKLVESGRQTKIR